MDSAQSPQALTSTNVDPVTQAPLTGVRSAFAGSDVTQPVLQSQPVTPFSSVASALPMAVEEAAQTLNPQNPAGSKTKEVTEQPFAVQTPVLENIPGVQYIDSEPSPENRELPPEVESFISEVKNNQHQLPDEIVVAGQNGIQPGDHFAKTPVIVLPITRDEEKKGARKSSKFSIRWLVEFSRKLMKMFSGRVIYRQVPVESE